jgi:ATP:ADP antiporter, AAA family
VIRGSTRAERAATLWTGVFLFAVVAAYYLMRPMREEIGVIFNRDQLIWLFTLTFAMIVAVNQPYMMLVNRLPVRRFLPIAMHLLAATFVGFAVLFAGQSLPQSGSAIWSSREGIVAALFYSWVTAFPVCATALVWVHAVDVFTMAQGKRLFGLIAIGGTAGQVLGSAVDAYVAELPRWLMAVLAALLLELSLVGYALARRAAASLAVAPRGDPALPAPAEVAAGGIWNGLATIVRSRYLQATTLFVLLSSIAATSFYFAGNDIVRANAGVDRRQFYAGINLWSGVATLLLQMFATGRLLLTLGIGVTLCAMAVYSLCGFAALWLWPAAVLFAWLEAGRRTVQFAFDKPAREVLFTPLDREAKYKAKAFIDTTVLRAGDLLGAVVNHLAGAARGSSSLVLGLPATALWIGLGWYLGRRCRSPSTAR